MTSLVIGFFSFSQGAVPAPQSIPRGSTGGLYT
jgi:hypothetical protein